MFFGTMTPIDKPRHRCSKWANIYMPQSPLYLLCGTLALSSCLSVKGLEIVYSVSTSLRKDIVKHDWDQLNIKLNSLCIDLCALLINVQITDIQTLMHFSFMHNSHKIQCRSHVFS